MLKTISRAWNLGGNKNRKDVKKPNHTGSQHPTSKQQPRSSDSARRRKTDSTATSKAVSIKQCTDLLREKYKLDISVWALWACNEDERRKREQLQRRSDALFREIERIVHHWRWASESRWAKEEWERIVIICDMVDAQRSDESS